MCQLLLVAYLASNSQLHINAVHPGVVESSLYQYVYLRNVIVPFYVMVSSPNTDPASFPCLQTRSGYLCCIPGTRLNHSGGIPKAEPCCNECEPFLSFQTAAEGALCPTFACLSSDMKGVRGQYLEACRPATPNKLMHDPVTQRKLFERTATLLQPYTDFASLVQNR